MLALLGKQKMFLHRVLGAPDRRARRVRPLLRKGHAVDMGAVMTARLGTGWRGSKP